MAADDALGAVLSRQASLLGALGSLADGLAGAYGESALLGKVYIDEFVREERSDARDDGSAPDSVLRVRDACRTLGLRHALRHVDSDYYEWALERRRDVLRAPSVRHLCKTIVMENTYSTATDCSDPCNSRYYCVIVQYTTRLNAEDVLRFVRGLKNPPLPKRRFNFRLCDPAAALALTGFEQGAVSPIGTRSPVPVILSAEITRLQPKMMWLGGGHIDWKLGVAVDEFVARTGCFVGDVVFAGAAGDAN